MDNQNIPAGQTIPPVPPQPTPQGNVPPTPSQAVSHHDPLPPVSPQTAPKTNIPPMSPGPMPQMNIPPRQLITQPIAPTSVQSQVPLQPTPMQPQTPIQTTQVQVQTAQAPTQTTPVQPQMAQASTQTTPVQPQMAQAPTQTTPMQPQVAQTPLQATPVQSQTIQTAPQVSPIKEEGTLNIPQRHSSRQTPDSEKKQQKNNRKKFRVFPIFLFLLFIGVIAFLMHLYKEARQEIAARENDIKELEAQLDDESARADAADADLEEYIEKVKNYGAEDSVNLTFMRHMFPDMVVLPAEGGFAYYPINKDLKMAEYDYSALKTSSSGVKSYVPDNIRSSYAGIDVSTFQGDIAWKKVADDNIDYAIIRLGYRGYGNGALVLDDKYKTNIKGATKNGLDVGVYFFTQAVNAEEAKEEAEFVLKNMKGYNVNYPVVIDTEMIESGKSRGNALTPEERTETIKVFCDTIKEAGYTPMIYANLTWLITALDVSQLEDYEKWFAGYETEPSYPYAFSMWQYTSSGTVNGISGAVDRNISFVNYAEK